MSIPPSNPRPNPSSNQEPSLDQKRSLSPDLSLNENLSSNREPERKQNMKPESEGKSTVSSSSTCQPIAYWNSRRVLSEELAVPATDAGFMFGITLAEQLRTFRGELFRVEAHLDRLFRGLNLLSWDRGLSRDELLSRMLEVVAHNRQLIPAELDLGLTVFVTPGTAATYRARDAKLPGPSVGIHSYPLPFWLWSDGYEEGQHLVVTAYRQVAANHWPTALKCRSRMHYYLADQAARQVDPRAKALLLDQAGRVAETSVANVVGVLAEGELVAPPDETALPGISLHVVRELASQHGWRFEQRPLELAELARCREILMTSTPYCLLPVVSLNGQPVGDGQPGPTYRQLLATWSHHVGLDIAAQSRLGG